MTAPPSLADQVIAAFGGTTATARALGHRQITTVHTWKRKGAIPLWRHAEIRAAAARLNVQLPPELCEPSPSPSPQEAA